MIKYGYRRTCIHKPAGACATDCPELEIWSGVEYGDPLTIYDGSNDLSTEIEKLSGNLGSFIISSIGNSLFVKFESDTSSYNNIGFFATINYGNSYLNII